jgi:glucose-6-phosphate 1-epimerase
VNESGRVRHCMTQGFSDTVLWNPGARLSQRLPDMDDDGYKYMVCVEAAVIAAPITLAPSQQWQGIQILK